MIKIHPFAISELLIIFAYLPLFLFIFIKGKSKLAKIYSLHILSVFIWGIGGFFMSTTKDPTMAYYPMLIGYLGVIFIPASFCHAVFLFTKKHSKIVILLIYLQAIFFSTLALTGQLWYKAEYVFNSFYWFRGNALLLWSTFIWIIIASFAHLQLIFYYKKCFPEQKGQTRALILAITGFVGGITNYFPSFGINIYPFGNFLVPIHSIVVTYAILKYQLFDIAIVIKRSVVYSLLIALISILYLLTVFTLEKAAQDLFGYHSLVISIFTAFVLGLIFVPLRHRIQQFVDRHFFRGTHEEIAIQNEQLRQEIAQSDKYKTLGTLATGIAHEVKNPLTAIKTFSEYLPQKLEDKQFLLRFSQIVGKEVDRIDNLIHQLLNYGKPAPLSLKDINIHKLLQDTIDVLNSRFVTQKIDVATDFYEDEKMHLRVDPNQIRQALLNVLLNAVEAMPNGGELHVKTGIERRAKGEECFTIAVKDAGSGISPDDLKHVFDPFFSKKDHGTGLGLPIVQGIMENHGGKVRVESRVGVGTEVRLELPLEQKMG